MSRGQSVTMVLTVLTVRGVGNPKPEKSCLPGSGFGGVKTKKGAVWMLSRDRNVPRSLNMPLVSLLSPMVVLVFWP